MKAMPEAITAIEKANHIVVIQAENPDGDSLASALALESILGEQGKQVSLYCFVDMPKYLRYLPGWDRVDSVLPADFDLSIIVDASTKALLERTLAGPGLAQISSRPVVLIDHHNVTSDLPLTTIDVTDASAVSAGQVVAQLAKTAGWTIPAEAAHTIAASILSDSLGLSSTKTTHHSIDTLADMVRAGANLPELDERRRLLNKKSLDIFRYKGRLFERVELHLEGKLALITIPWEEIERYSDAYNPAMLIIDEMRLIEGVQIAAVIKQYPNGKLTVKLRANSGAQFMDELAGHFGGGGHPFAAGFKLYDTTHEPLVKELLATALRMLEEKGA